MTMRTKTNAETKKSSEKCEKKVPSHLKHSLSFENFIYALFKVFPNNLGAVDIKIM